MDNILSLQQPESLFKTRYTAAIRIWHWLTALFMIATITMVLLAEVLFDTRDNVAMVQEQAAGKGGALNEVQARAVAHEFNDKLWEVHTWIGYGLCLLLLWRILIEITCPREQRLWTRIRWALVFRVHTDKQRYDRRHYLLVKRGYLLFYTLLLVMGLTGLALAFEDIPFFRSIRGPVKEVHEIGQWLVYGYIFFHIAGVIRADLTDNKGIVSSMINGGPQ